MLDTVTSMVSGWVMLFGVIPMIATVCYLLFIVYVHSRYDHLPGPKRTSFLFGNLLELKKKSRMGGDDMFTTDPNPKPLMMELVSQWADIYGDTYVFYILHIAIVVTRSPNAIKKILINGDQRDFPKSDFIPFKYLFGKRFLGEGLSVIAEYEEWLPRRKLWDGFFQRRNYRYIVESANISSDVLVNELDHHAQSGETFQLCDFFHRVALDVVFRTMFSLHEDTISTEFHHTAVEFISEGFKCIQSSIGGSIAKLNPFTYHSRKNMERLISKFRSMALDMIMHRRQLFECNNNVPDDLLSALIKECDKHSPSYDQETLLDDVASLVLAGMEASGNMLSLLFMELGRRPDLLQRLIDEVDAVVGDNSFISLEDTSKLVFTGQLIKETIRLYPVAPAIIRRCKKETYFDNLRIPVGSQCMISILAANHNGALLKDPLIFEPDRFKGESESSVPTCAFIPFSVGQRSCIGQVFALMEMKVVIAKFIQNYRFQLDSNETFTIVQIASIQPMNKLKGKLYHKDRQI